MDPEYETRTSDFRFGRDDRPTSTITVDTPPGDVGGVQPPDLAGPGEFSFERDVQPITKRYFRAAFGSGVDPVKAAAIYQRAAQGAKQSYVQNAQIRGIDEQSRNRRVDYEKSVFALESARDTARRERENMTRLLPLQDELTGILNDPNKDDRTKAREIGVLGVRYGNDPAASNILNSARSGVTKDEEKKKGLTVGGFYNLGGDPKELESLQKSLGRPLTLEDELPDTLGALGHIRARTEGLATNKAASIAEARDKAAREENADKALMFTPKWEMDASRKSTGNLVNREDEKIFDSVLLQFATPEELLGAKTAADKYTLIETIRRERLINRAARPVNTLTPRVSARESITSGMLGPAK